MKQALVKVLRLWNDDSGFKYTALNRTSSLLVSGVSLFLVATFFDSQTQGWYYYFLSLYGFQALFELGFNGVLTQFLAHELEKLRNNNQSQVSAIYQWGIRWSHWIAFAFLLFIGIPFLLIINQQDTPQINVSTWAALSLLCSYSLMLGPPKAVLEANHQIHITQRTAWIASLTSGIALWCGIVSGLGLISLIFSTAISLGSQSFLLKKQFVHIVPFLNRTRDVPFTEKTLLIQQQKKISLSWLVGFLGGQTLVPIVFAMMGAVAAGKVGMTLQISNAIMAMGSIYFYPKTPLFAKFYQENDLQGFLKHVQKGIRSTSFLTLSIGIVFLLVLIPIQIAGFDRLASYPCCTMMVLNVFLLQQSQIYSLSIRYLKLEPFLWISTLGAALSLLNFFVSSYFQNLESLFFFQLMITLILYYIGVKNIYQHELLEWQSKTVHHAPVQ